MGRVGSQVVVAVGSHVTVGRVDSQVAVDRVGSQVVVALGKKRHSLRSVMVHLPLMGRTVDSIHLLI